MSILKKYPHQIWMFFLIIVAFILRLYTCLHYGDFSWDELFSFHYSQMPWIQSFKFWTWETNPPLHMFVLKLWWYIFPATEFWARLPSLFFGIASIYCLYNFTKRISNQRIAIIAAALLSVSPYHIFISSTARGYSLLILLTIISINYFFKVFIENDDTRNNKSLFALSHLLLILTHLTGAVVVLCELVVLLGVNKRKIINWIMTGLAPILIWIVWAIPAFLAKANIDTAGKSWFFNIDNDWLNALFSLQTFIFGLTSIPARKIASSFPFAFIWIALILIIILFISGVVIIFRRQIKNNHLNTNMLIVTLLFSLPLIIAIILRLWQVKFFTVSLPFFIILIAYIFNEFFPKKIDAILMIVLINVFGLIMLAQGLPINDWSGINNYLQSRYDPNKKQILVYNHFVDKLFLERYLKVPITTLPYLGPDDKNQSWDHLLIKKNYYRYIHPDIEMLKWYRDEKLLNYDQIFLLKEIGVGIDIDWTLIINRWHFDGGMVGRLGDLRALMLYEHPKNPTSTIKN